MKNFMIALQFLTPIPLPLTEIDDQGLGRSMAWFPVVGVFIGSVLATVYLLGNLFLPQMVASSLVMAAMIFITGGLHLDGLADTIDGLNGGKTREEILKIMHDDRIGAMGAMGIGVILLVKFACIYSLPGWEVARSLIAMAVLGRWSMVFSCWKYQAGGGSQSLGRRFIENVGRKEIVWATTTSFVLLLILSGWKGLFVLAIALIAILLFNFYLTRKIGGPTGDTMGGLSEVVESIALLSFFVIT